jgi:deoxyhypusine synthase
VTFPYEDFDLADVRTYPLASRPSKVQRDQFARVWDPATGMPGFLDSLPKMLGAADLLAVVAAMRGARDADRGIVWGFGAHVLKVGLGPILIDLMRRGYVSAIAMNGAGIIHDVELALAGHTSEDVDAALGKGQFGMSEETGRVVNEVIAAGVGRGLGLGQSVVEWLGASRAAHADVSVLAAAARYQVPVTVHVAIGTDIIHMHPAASGEAIGAGSLRDFRYFTSHVGRLAGGVYLNVGSAVLLPEVFLKAVSLVRNRGIALDGLTTANFDFLKMYRAETNVVRRPVAGIGKGYSITGHHEILLPLLAAALL